MVDAMTRLSTRKVDWQASLKNTSGPQIDNHFISMVIQHTMLDHISYHHIKAQLLLASNILSTRKWAEFVSLLNGFSKKLHSNSHFSTSLTVKKSYCRHVDSFILFPSYFVRHTPSFTIHKFPNTLHAPLQHSKNILLVDPLTMLTSTSGV